MRQSPVSGVPFSDPTLIESRLTSTVCPLYLPYFGSLGKAKHMYSGISFSADMKFLMDEKFFKLIRIPEIKGGKIMLLTTTEYIESRKILKTLGLVKGNTIRARNIGRDIIAGLRTIVGGEISGYTVMMNEAREEAVKRMQEEAQKLGADAIISVRFTTSTVMQGAAELLAYGTAVKLKK